MSINNMAVGSGRRYGESGEVINIADEIKNLTSEAVAVALTRTQGAGTTLTVALTHLGRVALTTPITIVTGDVLYKGDKFSVTVVGGTAVVTGATEVSAGVYIVDGGVPVTVTSAA